MRTPANRASRPALGLALALAAALTATAGLAEAKPDRNTHAVRAWYAALARGDVKAAARARSPAYVEHTANFGNGAKGFAAWAKARDLRRKPYAVEVLNTVAEGDYVSVFERGRGPKGEEIAIFDLYRLDGAGKLAEHWGIAQPTPTGLLHTNGFVTTPPALDPAQADRTEVNRKAVMIWFEDVLGKGQVDRSSEVQQDDYIQHAEAVATGDKGFREFAARLDLPHHPFKVDVLKTVAQDDYVFVFQRYVTKPGEAMGPFKGVLALMDLIRMKDGKLAEHWGAIQASPPASELGHDNAFVTQPR